MTWTPVAGETKASFLGLATVNVGSNDVRIYADVKDTAKKATFKFADLGLSVF
jgi:hypothetical protein